jgi:hypothetical protein
MHVDLVNRTGIEQAPDLVHRVRALSYFKRHVTLGVAEIARHHGLVARFDDSLAAKVFVRWIEALVAQKAYSEIDRRDYIAFGAGMLLRTLIELQPIHVSLQRPRKEDESAGPWPAGILATAYCVSVLDAVLAQEGFDSVRLTPAAEDAAIWQSFRENVTEDPRLAIPYFDLFIGNEPNWIQPTWARARFAQQSAADRLHRPRLLM